MSDSILHRDPVPPALPLTVAVDTTDLAMKLASQYRRTLKLLRVCDLGPSRLDEAETDLDAVHVQLVLNRQRLVGEMAVLKVDDGDATCVPEPPRPFARALDAVRTARRLNDVDRRDLSDRVALRVAEAELGSIRAVIASLEELGTYNQESELPPLAQRVVDALGEFAGKKSAERDSLSQREARAFATIDALRAENERLRAGLADAVRRCINCGGRGEYETACPDPQCGDSTWDHECGGEDVPCERCAPQRAALGEGEATNV